MRVTKTQLITTLYASFLPKHHLAQPLPSLSPTTIQSQQLGITKSSISNPTKLGVDQTAILKAFEQTQES